MSENPVIEGVRKDGERVRIDISLTPVNTLESPMVLAIIHDTSRASESYAQRLVELTTLAEISKLSKTDLDAREVVNRLARQVRTLIPYDRFVIVMFDRMNSIAKDWYVAGEAVPEDKGVTEYQLTTEQVREYLSLRDPFITRAAKEQDLLSSVAKNVERIEQGFRALLCAPLIWNNEILGVINFRSKSETAYNDESLHTATQISTVVATAIGRNQTMAVASLAEYQQSILKNLSQIASQAIDIRSIFDTIAVQVDQLIPVDRIVLNSVNRDTNRYVIEALWGIENPKLKTGVSRSLTNTASLLGIEAGATTSLNTEQIQHIVSSKSTGRNDPDGMNSWIVTPLFINGQIIGTVNFRSSGTEPYTQEHQSFATQMSSIFAAALSTSNAINDGHRERQIRNAVVEVNRQIIEGENIETLVSTASEKLGGLIEFDRFVAETIDVEKAEVTVIFKSGEAVDDLEVGHSMAYSRIENTGNSAFGAVEDLPSPWNDRLSAVNLNSWMYVAMGGHSNEPVGALWVSSKRRNSFTQRDLEILERFGGALTPTFQNEAHLVTLQRLEGERERAEGFSAQAEILESEAKAKSEFISSISHEFKTPLTSVVAFSSLLRRDKSMTDRQNKQLDLIQNNAWRLERMIDDLLHVASADSGGLSFKFQEVNVLDTVLEVCEGLKPVAISAGKRLVGRSSTTQATAMVDPVRIAQAVQNVMSNAIKYSPARTGITVSTCEIDGNIEILVRNRGSLSHTEIEQVFTRFTRLDNELTRSTPGTGLGLAITREILAEMDGSVSLKSDQRYVEARISVPIYLRPASD
jgi:signal transduction histidine kinase